MLLWIQGGANDQAIHHPAAIDSVELVDDRLAEAVFLHVAGNADNLSNVAGASFMPNGGICQDSYLGLSGDPRPDAG
jgi:hypothetical protein